jgi:hypothetical protein
VTSNGKTGGKKEKKEDNSDFPLGRASVSESLLEPEV